MRTFMKSIKIILFLSVFLILAGKPVLSDDTCIFQVSADDVPPNIVLLLDNGAEMEHIIRHSEFDNSIDYTPTGEVDVTDDQDPETGYGFYNDKGYAIIETGNQYYLVPINEDLSVGDCCGTDDKYLKANSGNTWIINNRTITLPANPSTVKVDGVIDKATIFRYSKNYLNWLFYGSYVDVSTGTDLPDKSRLYYAKKAIFEVAALTQRQAYFGVYNFKNTTGASRVQPLGFVYKDGDVDPNFENTINNMGTVTYSPLAEGLASVGGYYASKSSETLKISPLAVDEYCQKSFVIVITPGISSEDQDITTDHDGDGVDGVDGKTITIDDKEMTIPVNQNGSTYLDDVAYDLYSRDVVDYQDGFQNVMTYTIGFMGNEESNAYLINASNNGNGNLNLYDTGNKEYGKYHFEAENPDALSGILMSAINAILSKTSSFTAPVVPVTRTTSGNQIYLAFFKPGESNFWEGNVTKFGLNSDAQILDKDGNPATWPNGAMKEDAEPYWATINWADTSKSNGVSNSARNIYTYLGSSTDLTGFSTSNVTSALLTTYDDATGPLELNNITGTFIVTDVLTGSDSGATAKISSIVGSTDIFYTGKSGFFRKGETVTGGTSEAVGTITNAGTTEVIQYIRGADVYDEDGDGDITDNRNIICGDPLHSEPIIVNYGDIDSSSADTIMVFFGANDGMLHAVNDDDGTEAWSFIPPDLLPKLKNIIEASEHQYYVDSSPAILIKDYNNNGIIDTEETIIDDISYQDKVYLVCGERKGGTSYFALDVTVPTEPKFLWRIAQTAGIPEATTVIPELGETWSTPQFGVVKIPDPADSSSLLPIDVVFIGGGYSEDNSKGRCILAINAATGEVVKEFTVADDTGMTYSIPSKIFVLDRDYNGFTDKLYVGDMGGQIWRINVDENIDNWEIHKLFTARCNEIDCTDTVDADSSKFFYPPTVTLEIGYDLLFIGSGDRDDACNTNTYDALYAIKDQHDSSLSLVSGNLVDAYITSDYTIPDLAGSDNGWYLQMEPGEKALSESVVFNKVLYATTFLPNDQACVPGGYARLYALKYLTGVAAFDFDGVEGNDTSKIIGGGIPSKPVVIITTTGVAKLLISTSSTNPDADSEGTEAGVTVTGLVFPQVNFLLKWWRELFN